MLKGFTVQVFSLHTNHALQPCLVRTNISKHVGRDKSPPQN